MLSFLHGSAALKSAEIEPERDVSKIDVIGRCKDTMEVEIKTTQLALKKQKEQPVIIFFHKIDDCERVVQ